MILHPINLVYFGDLFRFMVDLDNPKGPALHSILRFEDGLPHSEMIAWSSVPTPLKEMILEKLT